MMKNKSLDLDMAVENGSNLLKRDTENGCRKNCRENLKYTLGPSKIGI